MSESEKLDKLAQVTFYSIATFFISMPVLLIYNQLELNKHFMCRNQYVDLHTAQCRPYNNKGT